MQSVEATAVPGEIRKGFPEKEILPLDVSSGKNGTHEKKRLGCHLPQLQTSHAAIILDAQNPEQPPLAGGFAAFRQPPGLRPGSLQVLSLPPLGLQNAPPSASPSLRTSDLLRRTDDKAWVSAESTWQNCAPRGSESAPCTLTTAPELTGHLVYIAPAGRPLKALRMVKRRQSPQRRPHAPLRTPGPLPACRTRSPSARLRARSARAQGVLQRLAPRAPVLVLRPPPPGLKRKKQSIMGNGVLHSKHQKRAKPTPPSPSIPGLVGEKPRGRGVLFTPPRAPPRPAPPQVPPPQPKGQRRRRKEGPPRFPRAPRYPSTALLLLCSSQVPPAPFPPRPLPPSSQPPSPLPAAPTKVPASARSRPSQVARAATPRRPARSRRPRDTPPVALRGPGRALPPAEPEEEEKRGDASRRLLGAAGSRLTRAPPPHPGPDGAGHWPGGHHLRSAPSPRPSLQALIKGAPGPPAGPEPVPLAQSPGWRARPIPPPETRRRGPRSRGTRVSSPTRRARMRAASPLD
uniref:Basic proline-rich protein-like n=1 Tax=Callorhinus ursinus TaxID=34884 RepID=A0A3Q7MMS4_CALUR|nr:basic proline-rich protein-like [Callorhinus ursinus]